MNITSCPFISISGLGSGVDPDPGIGVAYCLREGFPGATLIGREYSYRAAGLHLPVLDRVLVRRPWSELSLEDLAAEYGEALDAGHLVISTIDLEVLWLGRTFGHRPALLVPPPQAFAACTKPLSGAVEALGLRIPMTLSLETPRTDLHGFLRQHGPRTWLKGAHHNAVRVPRWEALATAIAAIRQAGATGPLHLQRHVHGVHEAIAFCAWGGALIDAVWISKREMTRDGKTLSGGRLPFPADMRERLTRFVAETAWHGGGEIELVRESGLDNLWVIDINPRFPAWIHGGALLGCNLPAQLVAKALGTTPSAGKTHKGFVRVHVTVPLRDDGHLVPPFVLEAEEPLDANKHGAALRQIAARIGVPATGSTGYQPPGESVALSPASQSALDRAAQTSGTPMRIFLEDDAERRFARLGRWHGTSSRGITRIVAYSIKTNPDPRVLALARAHGLWAEAISAAELKASRAVGFSPDRLVLNGPVKELPLRGLPIEVEGGAGVAVYGVDSVSELADLLDWPVAAAVEKDIVVALRLRPPRVESRFGIPMGSLRAQEQLLELLGRAPSTLRFGVHIHIASAVIGRERWRDMMLKQMETVSLLFDDAGRHCVMVNLGGGGYPEDLEDDLTWLDATLMPRLDRALPRVERLVIEPGRAAVQDLFALMTTIVDVREGDCGLEVLVDASIADMPEADHFPHRVLVREEGDWQSLVGGGGGRILGRTCMEADILAEGLTLPAHLRPGDRIVMMDVGAYDRSMSYDFARG